MFRRVFFAAIAAGFLSGVLVWVLQEFTTVPIIQEAEKFERGEKIASAMAALPGSLQFALWPTPDEQRIIRVDGNLSEGDEAGWRPSEGLERSLFTLLASVLICVGYAMLLGACYTLHGEPINGRRGVLWGLAGFTVFTLVPSLGLPPEVPGSLAASIDDRQVWWIFAVIAAGLGLWLMVFGKNLALNALGIGAIILPYAIGAPRPEVIGGNVPPELASEFTGASIVITSVMWAMLGWFSGTFHRRFSG